VKILLLDTNVVSILFKPAHTLHASCVRVASGNQLVISFMTRAELLLWPRQNLWGSKRSAELLKHMELHTTVFADEGTCIHWADIVALSRLAGRPITTADAWIAAMARQWDLPLVTVDHQDFEHVQGITVVPVAQ
jgi:predicted nucleic acid-binding protein